MHLREGDLIEKLSKENTYLEWNNELPEYRGIGKQFL